MCGQRADDARYIPPNSSQLAPRRSRSDGRQPGLGRWSAASLPASQYRRPAPGSAPRAAAADDLVTLNFVNADIDAVVKAVAEITGRNFVARPQDQGHGQHHLGATGAEEPRLPDAAVGAAAAGRGRDRGQRHHQARARVRRQDARRRSCVARSTAGGDRLTTQVIPLRYESARADGQRAAPADHAQQHDRGVSRHATRSSSPTTPTTCAGSRRSSRRSTSRRPASR